MSDAEIGDLVEAQIERQGVSCIRVSDGHVFTFTADILEKLLNQAWENDAGRVVMFVQWGAQA